jgi:hypothetical protein
MSEYEITLLIQAESQQEAEDAAYSIICDHPLLDLRVKERA